MYILGIETSCDETACAVVKDGVEVISEALATSAKIHELTGGIVPEVAARKQVESLVPVIAEVLNSAAKQRVEHSDIDAVAVTVGPGLAGSLLVGIGGAKALSYVWNKPVIPVNHLVGHVYANFIGGKNIQFPAVALVVSGGHTDLVLMKSHGVFEYIGGTLDDAAGEAFDKVARLLNLKAYYGGKTLSDAAAKCAVNSLNGKLPRPMINEDNFNFSFSGLKTAVKRVIEEKKYKVEEIAQEFENAVVDVLVKKSTNAVRKFKVKSFLLGGGVASNSVLRRRLKEVMIKESIEYFVPDPKFCTDTASYIATAAYFNYKPCVLEDVKALPSLSLFNCGDLF